MTRSAARSAGTALDATSAIPGDAADRWELRDRIAQAQRHHATRVAGRACTLWDVRSGRDSATSCLTADGVLLRAEGRTGDAAGSTLEAVRVQDGPQPPALFHPPAGGMALRVPDVLKPFLNSPR